MKQNKLTKAKHDYYFMKVEPPLSIYFYDMER